MWKQTKKNPSLTAVRTPMRSQPITPAGALLPALAALLLLTGSGMAVTKVLSGLQPALPVLALCGLIGLAAALCWRPVRPWRIACLAAGLLIAAMLLLVPACRAGAVACLDGLMRFLTRRSGYLYFGFAGKGDPTLFLALCALVSGALCGAYVRLRSPFFSLLGMLIFGLPCMLGFLTPGLWFVLGLAGCLLLLASKAAGGALHPLSALPMVCLAVLAGAILFSVTIPLDRVSHAAHAALHVMRYEESENPMPEGDLKRLAPYRPGGEAALDVTMEHWTPLYLRGFVGERYTEEGWAPLRPETVAEQASLLYNLQKSYFYPTTQLAAADRALGTEAENRITVTPRGACAAYQYLPYGAGDVSALDPRALADEGAVAGAGFAAAVYPVEDAYLTQRALSGETKAKHSYLDGEAAYRDFVYDHYTAIPDTVYAQLADHFPLGDTSMTTTEAKWAVRQWLDTAMTYDAYAISGSGDFLRYLLEFDGRGHSVHYATVTTLLLRACGIPARYVEGYTVTSEEAKELDDGARLQLTQANSHAWTEYYLDGVGWLPFDTTPDYADEIVYRLPEDGQGDENGDDPAETGAVAALPQRNLQIDTSDTLGEDSGPVYVLYVLLAVLLFLLLLALALLAQSCLLRHRLRRRIARFRTLPPDAGSADCLRYLLTVLRLCGMQQENLPATKRAAAVADTLGLTGADREQAEEIVWLATEVWYSGHTISEDQRQQALAYLEDAYHVWKHRTSAFKRFKDRWITCRIL